MKLRKTHAAVFAALMAVGAGVQAATITSVTGSGTFTGGVASGLPFSGTLTMDVDSGAAFFEMIPNAFEYLGGQVNVGSTGTGLSADDSGTIDFTNFAITWSTTGGTIYPIDVANGYQTIAVSGGNVDLTWGGNSGIGATDWTFSGSYEVAPIPVPAAAWLFGSALLGLVGVARRRKGQA